MSPLVTLWSGGPLRSTQHWAWATLSKWTGNLDDSIIGNGPSPAYQDAWFLFAKGVTKCAFPTRRNVENTAMNSLPLLLSLFIEFGLKKRSNATRSQPRNQPLTRIARYRRRRARASRGKNANCDQRISAWCQERTPARSCSGFGNPPCSPY